MVFTYHQGVIILYHAPDVKIDLLAIGGGWTGVSPSGRLKDCWHASISIEIPILKLSWYQRILYQHHGIILLYHGSDVKIDSVARLG